MLAKRNDAVRKNRIISRLLARLEGLEPPTYWFVASHSIQLSYKRVLNCCVR